METAILMAEDRNEARKSKENLAVMLRRNNAAKRESLLLGMYTCMYVRSPFICISFMRTTWYTIQRM